MAMDTLLIRSWFPLSECGGYRWDEREVDFSVHEPLPSSIDHMFMYHIFLFFFKIIIWKHLVCI